MGQYFLLANIDKKEWVSPWDVGGVAKLWEWCFNPWAGLLPYLLRKSTDFGAGGDIDNPTEYVGRWAGDRIVLVGDYDDSGLYAEVHEYTNISIPLAMEFNQFAELPSLHLEHDGYKKPTTEPVIEHTYLVNIVGQERLRFLAQGQKDDMQPFKKKESSLAPDMVIVLKEESQE